MRSLRSLLCASRSAFLALAALGASAFAAAPARPPLTDIVDDQTAFALVVPDVNALMQGWDASPFAKTWGDEQIVKYLAPLRQQLKMDQWDEQTRAATGKTVRELLALAKGGAMVAVPASLLSDLAASGQLPAAPAVLFAVELGDNAATVEKLALDAARKNEGLRVETTNYAGVLVQTNVSAAKPGGPARTPAVSAMCDGVWLLSPSYDRICAAIDALKKGGLPNALGRSEGFLRAQKRAGVAHLTAYGNFPAIYTPLLAGLKKALPPAGTEGGPPFTAEGLLTGLGLDALREMVATLRFDAGETRLTSALGWSEQRGLAKLLAYGPGPAKRPDWAAAKWFSVASDSFDLRAAYAALEEMVGNVSPQLLASMQEEIKTAGTQAGIDLKRDLVGSLGSDLLVAQSLPPGTDPAKPPAVAQADTLIALSLENPAALVKSLEAIKRMVFAEAVEQMFTKREYLGQTLYTFSPPAPADAPPSAAPGGFTYAVADRTLLLSIGSPAMVETAVQNMAEKRDSFWARRDVRAVLADVPEGAVDVQAQDFSLLITSLVSALAELPSGAAPVDRAAAPDPARIARYWGLFSGYMTKDAKSIFSVLRIASPKP